MAAQGTTTYPAAIDAVRENPSNMDSSEAAVLALQTRVGVQSAVDANGALSVAGGQVMITKDGVCALTLAAPTVNGTRLTVTSTTANAHTITTVDLIHDGTTGTHDLATFAAFPGASLTLEAYEGLWYTVANVAVTITT